VDGFAVREQDNAKVAIVHLWHLAPAPDAPILLNCLSNRRFNGVLNPCVLWLEARRSSSGVGRSSVSFQLLDNFLRGYALKTRAPPKLPPADKQAYGQEQKPSDDSAGVRRPSAPLAVEVLKRFCSASLAIAQVYEKSDLRRTNAREYCAYRAEKPLTKSAAQADAPLTVKLRGRIEAPAHGAEGAQSLSARGANPEAHHGPLQRLLGNPLHILNSTNCNDDGLPIVLKGGHLRFVRELENHSKPIPLFGTASRYPVRGDGEVLV
jgi:hypothetical protein